MLEGLGPDDLDRVVDRRWDPPVTMGVRLVSIADDCLQHVGQAAYVRGILIGTDASRADCGPDLPQARPGGLGQRTYSA